MAESALDLFAMAAALADESDDDGAAELAADGEHGEHGDTGPGAAAATKASRAELDEQLQRFLRDARPAEAARRVHSGNLDVVAAQELEPEDFEEAFLLPGRPVALAGCAETWPARTWSADSLGADFGEASFALYTGQKFTLREYLTYARGRGEDDECPLYLFEDLSVRADATDKLTLAARDAILAGYSVPRVFTGRDLFELPTSEQEGSPAALEGRPRFRWLLIGPARSGTRIHYDPVGTSAWNTLLEGHKRWVLIPPDASPDAVRQFRRDVSVERWFAEVLPQLDREALGLIEFTQGPGDTVFVPRGWWHIVVNLDMTVAVTQNFASSANLANVAQAMRLQRKSPFKTAWFEAMQSSFPDEGGFLRRVPLPGTFAEGLEGCRRPQEKPALWGADDAAWLRAAAQRYDQVWTRPRKADATPIPRIVHHIWLGNKAVPNHGDWVKSWQRFLEADGWELRLWRDADCAQLGLENEDAFKAASNAGKQSDIARYEILRRFGGVYVDVDFECVRSISEAMDELAALGISFVCGLSNVGAVEVNNAFIASVPEHPMLDALVHAVRERPAPTPAALGGLLGSFLSGQDRANLDAAASADVSSQTIARTGPGLFTRTICPRLQQDPSVLVLPPQTLYPLANNADPADSLPAKDYAARGALAVHHWARSWQEA